MRIINLSIIKVMQLIDHIANDGVEGHDVFNFIAEELNYKLTDAEIEFYIDNCIIAGYSDADVSIVRDNLEDFRNIYINQHLN